MTAKIKVRRSLIALIAALPIGLVLLWMFRPDPQMSAAKRDIIKIEAFRQAQGRLPETLSEISVQEDESGPVYYQKKDETSYILWYGLSLGESETYDSRTGIWQEHS